MLSFSRSSSSPEQLGQARLPDPRYGLADSLNWTQNISYSLPADIVYNKPYPPPVTHARAEEPNPQPGPGGSRSEPPHDAESPLLPSIIFDGPEAPRQGEAVQAEISFEQSLGTTQTSTRPLHKLSFGVNGRLPNEAPMFRTQEADEDPAPSTLQEATQPYLDPRRQGTRSSLIEQDETDVLCILLPSSGPALKAVDLVAETTPQHILQNHYHDDVLQYDNDPFNDLPSTKTRGESQEEDSQAFTQPETQEAEVLKSSRPARDIALRMSSKVHNPCLGFVFGRNPHRCDLLINAEAETKLSNSHFRIFVNRHGVLMLEDTSTNGTFVDKVLLKSGKNARNEEQSRTRTLNAGAIIELPTINRRDEEMIRFIVRFPQRDHMQEVYNQTIAKYLLYIEQAERQLQVAAAKKGDMPPPQLMPFNAMKDKAEASPNASILAAATADFNHGFGWNGGEKYNVVSYIGKGAFAMVCKLSAKHNGEVYACKQIEKRRFIKDGVLNHKVHNEILVMKDLQHPNIVKYVEYHETKTHIFIIMEFVPFGDLSVYTESATVMPEYVCRMMASQIIQALDYLHKRKITHRDIKPDNILISSQNPLVFKLSDFGLSKIINNEETFLKSFCGTLLYCAPEVYPGFQRARIGLHPTKRNRSWEPRKGTLPYEHSVDTWSISAVLFHLLCGHAPYSGSGEDEGATMLMNIMRTIPNWERLEQAGISPCGIDFIRRTLVIEPSERAQEAELLQHPWVTGKEVQPGQLLPHLGLDGADDLDASQLSLADREIPFGFEATEDDVEDAPEAKRSKYHENVNEQEPTDLFGSPGDEYWADISPRHWNGDQAMGNVMHPKPQPNENVPQTNRLFGEIGSSALRSSGVLGNNAHAALEVPEAGSDDPHSVESSYMNPEMAGAENVSYSHPPSTSDDFGNTDDQQEQHPLQYPQLLPGNPYAGAAPSLLGAEELVNQLHMASPGSGVSWSSVDSKPVTPRTPASREASPGITKHTPHVSKSPQSQRTPQSFRPQTAGSDGRPSQSSIQRSAPSTGQTPQHSQINTSNLTGQLKAHGLSDSPESSNQDGDQRDRSICKSDTSLLPTAYNSQGSMPEGQNERQDDGLPAELEKADRTEPPMTTVASSSNPTATPLPTMMVPTQNSSPPKGSFAKPPIRFGNLRPVPGSVHTVPIKITAQATTFGRHPCSDFVHPQKDKAKVPKRAIDIAMWYRGMEDDLANGKTDWPSHPNLTAIVSTRTNLYIKVNGIRLMQGTGCWNYGKLRTGDIITVFEPPEGVSGSKQKEKSFLKFECEFFIGKSKERRAANEPFVVEKEEVRFREAEAKKSREGSFNQCTEGAAEGVAQP